MSKTKSQLAQEKSDVSEIRVGRHCVFQLHAHLVFVTKYRKKIFSQDVLQTMEQLFRKIANDFEVEIVEFNGETDHVHLLINFPPKVALSKLVNSLKGVSSRKLRQIHPELGQYYYKDVLWSPSYFVASCGEAPLSILKQYIQNQDSPSS